MCSPLIFFGINRMQKSATILNKNLTVNMIKTNVREAQIYLDQQQIGGPGSAGGPTAVGVGVGSGAPYGPGLSPQPGFSYRNVWKPLTISFIGRC